MGDVRNLINANSFAVIGASEDEKKVGHVIFKNLLKENKKVYPVNPNRKEILGKEVFPSIMKIPHEIDCAIIATPALTVLETLKQSIQKGVSSVVIISSGFSEIGNKDLEEEISNLATKHKITLLGPNSFGFINTKNNTNTTFFEGKVERGNIAFISQSGAIASAVLDKKEKLSGFASVGNSGQKDFSDFVEYYSKDKETKVICLYLESLKENKGKRFLEICKKCEKPIVVLKAGKSKAGQKAAATHTAALASEKEVYSGIFKQAGLIEVDSIKQLFQVAHILEKHNSLGKKACIVTNAGGPGVLTSDYCEENKIKIPALPEKVKQDLNKILPHNWSKNNPVDILGDGDSRRYNQSLSILDKEDFFDFFIVLLTPQNMAQPLETAKVLKFLKKPVFACFIGKEKTFISDNFMQSHGILCFDEPEELCDALGKIFNK
jgi:acetyltransferase